MSVVWGPRQEEAEEDHEKHERNRIQARARIHTDMFVSFMFLVVQTSGDAISHQFLSGSRRAPG